MIELLIVATAGLIGVGGTALGQWLQIRARSREQAEERQHHTAELRREAIITFSAACIKAHLDVKSRVLSLEETAGIASELGRTRSAVRLYAPEIADEADALCDAVAAGGPIGDDLAAYEDAARRVLGIRSPAKPIIAAGTDGDSVSS